MAVRADLGGVELRAYRPGDLLAMFHLDQVCFERRFRFSLHAMRDFAEAEGAVTVVAVADGVLVGFAIVENQEDTAYLTTLDVAPDWRRRGLAKAMMGWAESRVWGAGGRQMGLHVFVENTAAIGFYEGIGLRRMGRAEGFYGDGEDAFFYLKELIGPSNSGPEK